MRLDGMGRLFLLAVLGLSLEVVECVAEPKFLRIGICEIDAVLRLPMATKDVVILQYPKVIQKQAFIFNHSCPKQLLSPGFPQPNPLIRSGAGGHQKTRSATVHASCPGRQLARRREPSHESCSNMALCGLPVANLSGGGCSGRSLPVQNEIGEKLFWTRLIFNGLILRSEFLGTLQLQQSCRLGWSSVPDIKEVPALRCDGLSGPKLKVADLFWGRARDGDVRCLVFCRRLNISGSGSPAVKKTYRNLPGSLFSEFRRSGLLNANPRPLLVSKGALCVLERNDSQFRQFLARIGLYDSLIGYRLGSVGLIFRIHRKSGHCTHLLTSGAGLSNSCIGHLLGIDPTPVHLLKLFSQDQQSSARKKEQAKRENGHPLCSGCGDPRCLVGGAFLFLLGYALISLPFYVTDEPNPPFSNKIMYWSAVMASCFCICQGLNLVLEIV